MRGGNIHKDCNAVPKSLKFFLNERSLELPSNFHKQTIDSEFVLFKKDIQENIFVDFFKEILQNRLGT